MKELGRGGYLSVWVFLSYCRVLKAVCPIIKISYFKIIILIKGIPYYVEHYIGILSLDPFSFIAVITYSEKFFLYLQANLNIKYIVKKKSIEILRTK